MEGKVTTSIENNIGTISFYHPKSNSLPGAILNELAETITKVENQENVNVIILKSKGDKAFCAGASFDELISINDFETGKNFFMGFAKVINAMRKCSKFIISRIQGKVVGGGVGVVAASDYSFATDTASAKLSELALGIGPFVVGPAVERKIGNSAFSEMSIDYDWRTAEWCERKGLYNKVFKSIDLVDEEVTKLSTSLAEGSKEAMRQLKKVLWEGTDNWDQLLEQRAEISGKLVLSDFTKEYIEAFNKGNR
ncbi:MAG: enoyl-CoA hydratase/isomerase family protein [Melioribacteraceae bacterium]|nr:MAG: enoyl-CoA hydratase/isomerase family protein [Melioribacteraceae bacterium]